MPSILIICGWWIIDNSQKFTNSPPILITIWQFTPLPQVACSSSSSPGLQKSGISPSPVLSSSFKFVGRCCPQNFTNSWQLFDRKPRLRTPKTCCFVDDFVSGEHLMPPKCWRILVGWEFSKTRPEAINFHHCQPCFQQKTADSSGLWWRPWSFGDPIWSPLGSQSLLQQGWFW